MSSGPTLGEIRLAEERTAAIRQQTQALVALTGAVAGASDNIARLISLAETAYALEQRPEAATTREQQDSLLVALREIARELRLDREERERTRRGF